MDIPKTIIFIDKIEDRLKIAKYLWSLLFESMHKKRNQIIWTFSSNQEPSRQEFFIKKFKNRNTYILICIDITGMGVNIRNVACAIQWKILNYLILATLLQWIGRAGYNKTLPTVSIVFIEFKHILPNNIASVKNNLFIL